MKAFGYQRADIYATVPRELREVALTLSMREIDGLIGFLEEAREKFSSPKATPDQSHLHLRDWNKDWTDSDADLVIVYGS